MKRTLLSGLLALAISFAPHQCNFIDFQLPAFQITCALASPLFWQLWDEFLTVELAQRTSSPSQDAGLSAWPSFPESDTLFCLVFHALLNRAVALSQTPARQKGVLSVSTSLDSHCRTMGRHSSPIPGFSATQQRVG